MVLTPVAQAFAADASSDVAAVSPAVPAEASASQSDTAARNDVALSAPAGAETRADGGGKPVDAGPASDMKDPKASDIGAMTTAGTTSSADASQTLAASARGAASGISLNKPVVQSNTGALSYSYPIP